MRYWERGNRITQEGIRVRDTPYFPEEQLQFDEKGE